MTIEESVKILKRFNAWLRGGDDREFDENDSCHKKTGEALDTAIAFIESSENGTAEKRTNPYKSLAADPFEVQRQLGLVGAYAEAFKKIACAGIDGRSKTFEQDIAEAAFTVRRIIRDIDDGLTYPQPPKPKLAVFDILEMYKHLINDKQRVALNLFLTHCLDHSKVEALYSCALVLEKI